MKDTILVIVVVVAILFAFNPAGTPAGTATFSTPKIPGVNSALVGDIPFVDIPFVDKPASDLLADAMASAPKVSVTGGVLPRVSMYEPLSQADVDSALGQLNWEREDTIVLCTGPAGAWQSCRLQADVYNGRTVTREGGRITIK